jgi:raffinose/stachyose/melibiose transport system substrate-binding protein
MRALFVFLTLLLALPGAGQCAQRLVIFGPSSWDTFAPGAPERVVSAVTAALDAGFQRQHPEVTQIIHDSRGTVADGLARLRNAQFAGEQIDVIICAANRVNTSFAARALIVPVDDLIARLGDQFSAGAVGNFTLRGRVWAVPLSAVNVTTFFYNKRLFQQAGLAVPRTYAEFRAAVPRLRQLGVIPVVHQGKNAWMWPIYYMSALAQTTGNQPIAETEAILSHRARFTDPPSLQALRLTRRWVTDGLLDAQSNELDEDAMKSVFYSGRAAAFFGDSWDVAEVAATAPFPWGVFEFPQYADVPGHPSAFGGAESGLCLSSSSHQPKLAADYIVFAASSAQATRLLAPLVAPGTSHRDVPGASDPVSLTLRSYLPAVKFLDWMWPLELAATIQGQVQDMMGGTITPEQAASRMQAKYDGMVASGFRYHP